jgi:hypothetical protein
MIAPSSWRHGDDERHWANLRNEEKRAHLTDLRREHLIDQVCTQEVLPPEK